MAANVHLATSATVAHSVEILNTDPPNVPPETIYPIVTRLKPDAWEKALKDAGIWEQFSDIPEGLRKGFLCGLENFSLASTFIPKNHYVSEEDENFVINMLKKLNSAECLTGMNPITFFLLSDTFAQLLLQS
jgi:hypothetical protein